jgi:SAM-dependent methyltransferase|tara:strand:- start:355 stop:705 length:351 start_codon:yes stop_codon:yes gene_type:complete
MKAILINPKEQTIKEVEYKGDFKEIYSLVDCNTFDCVYLDNVEVLYVDDEGLYVTDNRFFSINSRVLAGNGLLLGSDAEGETIGTGLTLQMVKDMVEWMPIEHVETPYMSFKSFVD